MSKTPLPPGFTSRYGMNNIVIVPTDSSKPNPILEQQQKSEEKPINIKEDLNKNVADVADLNKTKKVNSWASNYLKSIGHNNLKPIKINLSLSKNKPPTETAKAAGIDKKIKNNINCKPDENKKLDVHIQGTPRFCETKRIITPIPHSCTVDTIYSNAKNAIAPAYATLLATRAGESTYYYHTENHSIDIFDAIKSKINSEFDIERNTRMMDQPNHKEMCENFIKEITKNKSPKKRKADYSSSSTKREKSEHTETPSPAKKKQKTTKLGKDIEKPEKKDKNLKTKYSEADRVKISKSQLNIATPNSKKEPDIKPALDLKDLDSIKKKQNNVKRETPDMKRVSMECENTSHPNIQSVVQVPENHKSKSPKQQCSDKKFDLRSKLSRVNEQIRKRRNYYIMDRLKESNTPMDNLKITVDNQIPEKLISPKKMGVTKPISKKCKKLKVIINVVCKESDDDSSSNDSTFSETENYQTQNMDLSFLDDFNVDEIVDSLKHSPIKKTAHEKSAKKEIEPELKLSTILSILNTKSEPYSKKYLESERKGEEVLINSVTSTEPSLVSHAENKGVAADEKKKQHSQILIQGPPAPEKLLSQGKLQRDQQNTHSSSTNKRSTIHATKKNIEEIRDDDKTLVIDERAVHKFPKVEEELSTLDTIKMDIEEISYDDKTIVIEENVVNKFPKIEDGSTNKIQFEKNVIVIDKVINDDDKYDIKEDDNHSEIKKQKNSEDSQKVDECSILNPTKTELNETEDSVIITEDNISIIDLTGDTLVSDTPKTYIMDLTDDSTDDQTKSNKTPSKEPLVKTTPIFKEPLIKMSPIKGPLIKSTADLTDDSADDEIKSNIANIIAYKEPLIKTTPTFMEPLIKTSPIKGSLIKSTAELKDDSADDEIKSNIANIIGTKEPLIKTTPTFMKPLIKTTPTLMEPLIKTTPTLMKPLIKTTPTLMEPLIKTTPTLMEPLIKTTPIKVTLIKTTPTSKEPIKTPTLSNTALMEKKLEETLHIKMKEIKCIHQGRFSSIFSCKDPSGEIYAAKLLKHEGKTEQEEILTRIQQDIPLQNLNTVFLLDTFAVKSHWCFIMEFYPKTLKEVLNAQVMKKPFHINKVQVLARQLISAVMLLRNNQIIHSDINPSHILLNDSQDRLKICGFDRAYYIHEANPIPNLATPNYRAPEIILGFSAGYGVDIWASALVIFEMATNKLLFKGIYNNEILYQQMATFGGLPWDMLDASQFRNNHFRGNTFMRRTSVRMKDSVPIKHFYRTKRMHESLLSAHKKHWFPSNDFGLNCYMFKLNAVTRLLEQMLVLDPRQRLATEFVLLDPFIFDVL